MFEIVDFIAQNPVGPRGADFGKASPIGLFILVLLLVVVLAAGWDMARRLKRLRARRAFAEKHDMDPFDIDAIDKAMADEARVSLANPRAAQAPDTDSGSGSRPAPQE
ncbi:hypothetical protein [Corynebacterium sp. TAE3-ERU12]|uniref:hypothetical protein n=1 Tax=Corynebacterium sp. TAE3-ERU12 TaxID=2849491 RepID=UPI0021079539|nr:hypothetical protein [Corynebacterium sp. TAE3-ERU12]